MAKKLTLNINNDGLIDLAKDYAKTQGQSLSNLVENFLLGLIQSSKIKNLHPKPSGELLKLKGCLKDFPTKSHDADPIYDFLMEKYS